MKAGRRARQAWQSLWDGLSGLARVALPSPSGTPDLRRVRRVLVYGGMGIGNLIMLTPALRALREALPDADITLLSTPGFDGQFVLQAGLVDECIPLPTGTAGLLRFIVLLRRRRFDLFFSTLHGIWSGNVQRFLWFVGIPWRIGHVEGPGWRRRYAGLFNIPVRVAETGHEVDRGLSLVAAAGIRAGDPPPAFGISSDAERAADAFIAAHRLDAGAPVVAIQVDTWPVQAWKRWDPVRLAAVCDELVERRGARIVAMGALDSLPQAREVTRAMRHRPVLAVGRLDLNQSAAVLRRCDLAICNDSGLMHMAAALGVPVVAIFGPTDWGRTSPERYAGRVAVMRHAVPCSPCFTLGDQVRVTRCESRVCLTGVHSEAVTTAAIALLQKAKEA